MLALGIAQAATEEKPQFYLGVTREVTQATLGKPTAKIPPGFDGKEIWTYGKAMVTFARGKVVAWQGFPEKTPLHPPGIRPLQLGASREETAAMLGFPPKARLYTALVIGAKPEGDEEWTYGTGTVVFEDGFLVGWRDIRTPLVSLGDKVAEPKKLDLNSPAKDVIGALGSPPKLTCYVKSGDQLWGYGQELLLMRGGKLIWRGTAQPKTPAEQPPLLAVNPDETAPDGEAGLVNDKGFIDDKEFATFRLAYQPVLDRMLQANPQVANTASFRAMQDCLNQRPWWAITAQADIDDEYAGGVDAIEDAYNQYLDEQDR